MSPLRPEEILKAQPRQKGLEDVYKNIQEDLEKVEAHLHVFSSSPQHLISEISSYLFQKKGKRIRPAVLLLCSKLFDYRGDEHVLMASLIEFIHTASLIHDDIIDNSSLRRGVDSVHTRWGPNISVLLGDYLYIRTLGLSLQSQHPQIIRILTDISARMIEGEMTEYEASGNFKLKEEVYFEIIQKKTASLFAAACQIGGILGRATPEEEGFLVDYGRNLGMTFQVIDDLLDFKGDKKKLGKPTLSDLGEGRVTLPLIYTVNNDGSLHRQRLLRLLKDKKSAHDGREEILEIVRSNGSLDYTYQKAEEFSLKSREILSRFPESSSREALSLLAEFVLRREK